MRARVTQLAWDGTRRVRPGDIIEIPDDSGPSSWYEKLPDEPRQLSLEETPKKAKKSDE